MIYSTAEDHYIADANGTIRDKKSHWNVYDGYTKEIQPNPYPYRSFGTSEEHQSVIPLLLSKNFTKACNGPFRGVKIFLHSPDEAVKATNNKHFFRVSEGQQVMVKLKPKMTITDDNLKSYHPDYRKCYYSEERELQYFKRYTQNNCELECLSDFMLSRCGCVQFSMLRNASMKICQQPDIKCYTLAREVFFLKQNATANEKIDCNCLPACTSLEYDYEILQMKWEEKYFLSILSSLEKNTSSSLSQKSSDVEFALVQMSFKDAEFLRMKRYEIYGFYDFVADCGGLLGKFIHIEFK